MKISEYIKEKIYLFAIAFLVSILIYFFLYVVRCNEQVIIIVLFLYWLVIAIILIVEFMRRRAYYDNIIGVLDSLDQKYLLAEVIPEPTFQDGRILYEVMRQVDKDMLEHVNAYKIREQEYKDYIEMWVHEIKTPLAASKLILNNNPSSINASLEEELEKVESFVEQALFYARSTTVEKDYLIKQMELQTVINKVIRKHSRSFIYRKIKLNIHEIEHEIFSDAKWLEFIIDQIITNALKYTKEEIGEIEIFANIQDDNILLHIKDNGVGIPLADLKRVFDKGFTGQNGRKNEKATGMGLYLCKLLCEKLYLDLRITSQEGNGTCVCIIFPTNSMMLLK